jgi:hypothetical protein
MKRLVAAVLVAATLVPSPAVAGERFPDGLPWAISEDRCAGVKRCVWDGRHNGNGEGRSYILVRRDGDYHPRYIRHRRAHRLQALWCQRPNVNCGYGE